MYRTLAGFTIAELNMTISEITAYLQSQHPGVELTILETVPDPTVSVTADNLHTVCMTLRNDPQLLFGSLMCLCGVDFPDELQTVYHLFSIPLGHKFTLKCNVPKSAPFIPSVADIWSTAEWHEREAFDMFGITYTGHPDMRRILCPDDWEGYPLRKDYVPQTEWHGIPLTNIPPSEREPNPSSTLPADRIMILKRKAK